MQKLIYVYAVNILMVKTTTINFDDQIWIIAKKRCADLGVSLKIYVQNLIRKDHEKLISHTKEVTK